MNALTLVATVNTLLQLVASLGVSWQRLAAAIAQAQAEGREFGVADLERLRDDAQAAIDRLDDTIAASKDDA
jgi:hypothetical protein